MTGGDSSLRVRESAAPCRPINLGAGVLKSVRRLASKVLRPATSRFNSPRSSRTAARLESIFVDALMTLSLSSPREPLSSRCGGPWLKPLGSGRFGKYSCLCVSALSDRLGRSIPSEAGTPLARGLSNFRYLFLRARSCPGGPRICAEFGFVGRDVEGNGDRLRNG
jgi:hypothetical protein